jgi:hypothetical protein
MRELLDTFLNRHPRIPFGIDSASRSGLCHLFGGISTECCRSEEAEKSDDDYDAGETQRSPNTDLRATTTD